MGRTAPAYGYFGDPMAPPDRGMLYSETQIDAWVYDGGAPLLVCYGVALAIAQTLLLIMALRRPDRELGYWGCVGAIFAMFHLVVRLGSLPFLSPTAAQFWVVVVRSTCRLAGEARGAAPLDGQAPGRGLRMTRHDGRTAGPMRSTGHPARAGRRSTTR